MRCGAGTPRSALPQQRLHFLPHSPSDHMPESSCTTSWNSRRHLPVGRRLQAVPLVRSLFRHDHDPDVATNRGVPERSHFDERSARMSWSARAHSHSSARRPWHFFLGRGKVPKKLVKRPSAVSSTLKICCTTPTTTMNWNVNVLVDRVLLEL